MDDNKIIELYWDRSEQAISETSKKYGRYCHYIAYSILHNDEDSEECVNDTYLRAWDSIPPQRPNKLQTFLGKITRNLSLNKWEKLSAEKRGAGQTSFILDELLESKKTRYIPLKIWLSEMFLTVSLTNYQQKQEKCLFAAISI